ncbi:MAG: aspartate aminotransferase family protein [Candidatus Bathyarchaeia archaeon]
MYEVAKRFLPGGDTRSAAYYTPYPVFMDKGEGVRLYDVDGNVYLDFLNNYTSMIHGHAHPKIVEAVMEQISRGTAYAAPTESQYRLGEIICERVKSVEQVRFCNSGTEATLMAIRAAIAYTGKDKVVKIEGGYHGSHDTAEISSPDMDLEKAGPAETPIPVVPPGVPRDVSGYVLVTPFNNREVAERVIKRNRKDLAAVIVEPVMGAAGMVTPKDGYLRFLREITAENDILLIFDEVITFRLSSGGAQELYGVEPDLTSLGKIIGGGYPVGAFGGHEEVMRVYNPELAPEGKFMKHSGTFNANTVTCAAGIASMELLTPQTIERINLLGDALRRDITGVFEELGVRAQVKGVGSLGNIHFNEEEIVDFRSSKRSNKELAELLHLSMLSNGIFLARRGMFNISTPMSKEETKQFIEALRKSLMKMKPVIKELTFA